MSSSRPNDLSPHEDDTFGGEAGIDKALYNFFVSMGVRRDTRGHTELTDAERLAIAADREVAEAEESRQRLKNKIITKYGLIKRARHAQAGGSVC